ncbi:MAG: hypothetical protein A4E23_01858 [Methanomethylovorans sp. PtaU1.Bin073]|nr:MAG: hypothetical protein A4E23_01858 [Methanomethylovorans sp. PtaU1.Bin073]
MTVEKISISMRKDVMEETDDLRGLIPHSAYIQAALIEYNKKQRTQ